MSNPNLARRTLCEISFDGVDITKSIRPYLLSCTYTDEEEDNADDLQIKLQDRDGIWMEQWLIDAVNAAASGNLKIDAVFVRENWSGGGWDMVLPCGLFELDSVDASGPPNALTIKATALPYSGDARQTKKTKAWEAYYLSGIANEISSKAGMTCMYESMKDPYYDRAEQYKCSDIDFLSKLCHNSGVSLKVTNNIIVLFDQQTYEAKDEALEIVKGGGSYIKYKLAMGSADTQYASCRVSYVNPENGSCIEGTANADGEDAKSGQVLEITAKVSSVAEAQELAAKSLRDHNKFERTASFTMPGDPRLVSGVTVRLKGWGGWDHKYIISQAKHSLSGSGYTTQITLRRTLEGY